MRMIKNCAFIIALAMLCNNAFAQQPALTITEITENGKRIPVLAEYHVIDPTSQLELVVDRKLLASGSNSLDKDITGRLTALKNILQAEKVTLNNVSSAIAAFRSGQSKDVYVPMFRKNGDLVRAILLDTEMKEIYQSLPLNTDPLEEYKKLFETARIMLRRLEDKLVAQATSNGVYVQLGAFLSTKNGGVPIHVSGFDDITPQGPGSLERFQIVLTPDQEKELKAITELAATANSEGLPAALRRMKFDVTQVVASLNELKSVKNARQLLELLKTLKDKTAAEVGALQPVLLASYTDLTDYLSLVDGLIQKYSVPQSDTDGSTLLLNINADIGSLQTATTTLDAKLKSNIPAIQAGVLAVAAGLQADVRSLNGTFNQLGTQIQADLKEIPVIAADIIRRLVIGETFAAEALTFSNKVKKFAISDIPEKGTIDLKSAGINELGNTLTIKLASGTGTAQPKDILMPKYDLYYTGAYARTAVGFLFVSPVPLFKKSDDKAFFRYAPSYSILLKGFWLSEERARKSIAYHKFYNPGIGFNFSAQDFNGDGSMELGIGGVFSIFQDFLQLGYGINTMDGRGYAFFGFKLPVGAFSIR